MNVEKELQNKKTELIKTLRSIASQCSNADDFQKRLKIELPNVCATILYSGRHYMGMAMSHEHRGTISF